MDGNEFTICMSMIGILFLAVIGVYVWTFKIYKDVKSSVSNVYKVMNTEFVREKVCIAIHESIQKDLSEIKTDVKTLLKKG